MVQNNQLQKKTKMELLSLKIKDAIKYLLINLDKLAKSLPLLR